MTAVLKSDTALPAPAPIHQLHHYAYRAKDAEETRHFYEDILGLPLYHIIQSDYVPSTGEYCPYTHFFFRLQDGSFIAFFDLGNDEAALPSPNTPLWVNHISFRVDSQQALRDMKARLEAHGVEVLGITDHHIFHSIYFFDPNGVRLELTAQLADEFQMLQESKTTHARLNEWTARKEQWRKDRASGKAADALKPQTNDRPEFTGTPPA
ncbi:MAG TPA: VOC family protein [Burkholderiaceae bacterium]|nr:VOC family protein [Burkholderiaceae bacterium]